MEEGDDATMVREDDNGQAEEQGGGAMAEHGEAMTVQVRWF